MATISNLIVNMIARTANFEAGMNRSKKHMKSFQAAAGAVTGVVNRMAMGFLAAAGIGGIGYMIKQTADMIDNTRDMANAMGVSTEFLTGMGYAAKQSGASIEEIGNALKFMNKNAFEAMQGTKGQKDAFNSLGITIDKLQSAKPEDLFIDILDSLSKIPNAAQRVNTALTIFGRGGGSLLPLISEGTEGIKSMMKEAERLGITFSGFDAAKVDAMNDAFYSMKMSIQGIANSFVIYIAPYAQAVYETITDMLASMRNMTIDAAAMANRFEVIKMIATAMLLPFKVLNALIQESVVFILKLGEAVSDVMSWLYGRTGFGWIGDGWEGYSQGFYRAAEDIAKENKKLWEQIAKDAAFATGFGNTSSLDAFFDAIDKRQKEIQNNLKAHPAGLPTGVGDPLKDRKFQEVNPNLINIAALYPAQNPLLQEAMKQTNILREIRDGQVA